MKQLFALLVCLIGVTTFADPAERVRCREIGFSIAAETRNANLFMSFIDNDARFVGNAVARGPAAVAEAWSIFFAADGPAIKWRPQFVEVLQDGRLALTRGPYRMITRDEKGKEIEHWGTFNSVWRLHDDGHWRVVFDAGNPASAPPDDAVRALLDEADPCTDDDH